MTAPTLVAVSIVSGTGSSKSSASLSLQAGDVVTFTGIGEGAASGNSFGTPTTTFATVAGITQLQLHAASSNCQGGAWTFTVATTGSGTITLPNSAGVTGNVELAVYAHRGAVQATAARSALAAGSARTLTYTASQADSSIIWALGDWAAANAQTPTPTPTTHSTSNPGPSASPVGAKINGIYTHYSDTLDDQNSTGAVPYGIGGTGSGPFTIVVVEVQGAGSAGTTYDVSGTAAASSSTTGAVTRLARTLAVAGTVAALSATSGAVDRVPQVQPVSGTVAATSSISGDVTRLGATLSVSGTVAALSGSSGDVTRPTRTLNVTGAAAALSSTSGDVTRVGATPTVSGTIAVTIGTQGAVTSRLGVSGTVAATSGTSGDATRLPRTLTVSGTTAAASATSLGVSVVGGPQTYPAAGTVSAVSSSSGALLRIRAAVTGTVAASSSSSGSVDVLRAPVTWQVAGTITAASGTNGVIVLIAQASGTAGATSSTSGNMLVVSPDDATANPAARLTLNPTPQTVTLTAHPSMALTVTPTVSLTLTRPELTLSATTYTVADTAPLTGSAGTDLTGASVEAHVKLKDGTTSTLTTTVTDAATGAWSAEWPTGGVPDVAGVASVELQVTYSDATVQTLGPVVFSIRSQYA